MMAPVNSHQSPGRSNHSASGFWSPTCRSPERNCFIILRSISLPVVGTLKTCLNPSNALKQKTKRFVCFYMFGGFYGNSLPGSPWISYGSERTRGSGGQNEGTWRRRRRTGGDRIWGKKVKMKSNFNEASFLVLIILKTRTSWTWCRCRTCSLPCALCSWPCDRTGRTWARSARGSPSADRRDP